MKFCHKIHLPFFMAHYSTVGHQPFLQGSISIIGATGGPTSRISAQASAYRLGPHVHSQSSSPNPIGRTSSQSTPLCFANTHLRMRGLLTTPAPSLFSAHSRHRPSSTALCRKVRRFFV
ncbi:hypothetical protein M758_2G215100 [Ceratodon purpureus]|nr:hypothetical protein M758_2G215100 [Ceratodon purpureus]